MMAVLMIQRLVPFHDWMVTAVTPHGKQGRCDPGPHSLLNSLKILTVSSRSA